MGLMRACECLECPNLATMLVEVEDHHVMACCGDHDIEGTVVYDEAQAALDAAAQAALEAAALAAAQAEEQA